MTGSLFLDWATMAVSLFNTILALWLGLTVLLGADRRTWGIWMASGGLLMGGIFFVSHSAILGHGLAKGVELWWQVGWLPVIALPLAWYLLTLWYAEDRGSTTCSRTAVVVLTAATTIRPALTGLRGFAASPTQTSDVASASGVRPSCGTRTARRGR